MPKYGLRLVIQLIFICFNEGEIKKLCKYTFKADRAPIKKRNIHRQRSLSNQRTDASYSNFYELQLLYFTIGVKGYHSDSFVCLTVHNILAPLPTSCLRFNIAYFIRVLSWPPIYVPLRLKSQLSTTRSHGLPFRASSCIVWNCFSCS